MFYKIFLQPLFFQLSPEQAHSLTMKMMKWRLVRFVAKFFFQVNSPALSVRLFGLQFPNRVGMAAGFDKNAAYLPELEALGFGHVEIGTVTPLPQPGNEAPRLFRLPADEALINRMGFNNVGVDVVAARLRAIRPKLKLLIGGNIGKNKSTPNEEAVRDYEICFRKLFPVVDYFVVNVSSPNTPGLRELQDRKPLTGILERLQQLNREEAAPKPILLKIAPDLSEAQLDEIVDIVLHTGIAGIVATNTTIGRSGLLTPATRIEKIGAGGLSGKPLASRSTEVIRYLAARSGKRFSIIGVGGINSPEEALEKLEAGADLLQLYTGLIYEGPSLVRRIHRKILKTPSNR